MMKIPTLRRGRAFLVSLLLITAALATTAVAQAPDDPGGPGGPPPGRPPFAFGVVSAVDANAGTITITPQFRNSPGGSNPQVIKITPSTQFITQSEIAAADLKVGDQIQVRGVPTGITVSRFTVGSPPPSQPGTGGPGAARTDGGNTATGNANAAAAAPSFAAASGTISALPTKTDPHLSITFGADARLSLRLADGAKVTRYRPIKITDIKNGDRVEAAGQTAADGTLSVSMVGVNLAQ